MDAEMVTKVWGRNISMESQCFEVYIIQHLKDKINVILTSAVQTSYRPIPFHICFKSKLTMLRSVAPGV